MTTRTSAAARDRGLDAAYDALDGGGFLELYDGTEIATPTTAITTQVLLAELALSADALAAASGGVKNFNAISDDASANAGGTATWGRFRTSAGVGVATGNVGLSGSGAAIIVNTTTIAMGARVSCSSASITQAMQA